MNNKSHMYYAIALKNIISMLCWTYLAVELDKWWIALFYLLTMTTIKDGDE